MLELLHSLNQIAASLLTVGLILAASLGIGATLSAKLRLQTHGLVERLTWSITLGLVAAGTTLALVGLTGLLFRPVIALGTLIAAAWGILLVAQGCLTGSEESSRECEPHHEHRSAPAHPPQGLMAALAGLVAVVGVCSLAAALAPPTAGDALCYHLELPKVFLAEHRLAYQPFHDNSTFPLLGEMWLLWGLALEGPVAAQLLAWCWGWLLAGATLILATPLVGRNWANVAGLATLLIPGINNHMAAPLVDVPTALLTTLALAAWLRATWNHEAGEWTMVTGILIGAACGTKYVALVWTAAWTTVVLTGAWRHREQRRELLRQWGAVLVIAASVGGLWYLRAAYHRGNPVYPFLSAWLPSAVPAPVTVDKTPLATHPLALLTAPWQVAVYPELVGGRGHRLGGALLMVLPTLFVARRLRGLAPLAALAALYAVGWYLLRQNVRFLYPIVPLLVLAAVWSLIELARWPTWPRRAAWALLALVVAVDAVGPVRRAGGNVAVACGWQSRSDFLLQHEPTYRAACVANAILSDEARILTQDYRAFYFDAQMTRESIYRRATQYDRRLHPAALSTELRLRGFTHLLLVDKTGAPTAESTTLNELVRKAQATETAENRRLACLDDYHVVDSDGVERRYRLIELR